jgi:hypothetical protein
MRLTHPRDIAAIKEWVNVHADPEQAQEMIASLAALPIGTAWFWSPGWLDVFRKVKIRRRETFDSSATPKVGDAPRRPRTLAEVDVQALIEQTGRGTVRASDVCLKRSGAVAEGSPGSAADDGPDRISEEGASGGAVAAVRGLN